MVARDLMQKGVPTLREDTPVADACDIFLEENVNGAPVVDHSGRLVGVVTQQDIFFGALGKPIRGAGPIRLSAESHPPPDLRVRDVMTSPAVCASEETEVAELCRLMWSMRIHRIPIVRDGLVSGVVSSMDLCHAVCKGTLAVAV